MMGVFIASMLALLAVEYLFKIPLSSQIKSMLVISNKSRNVIASKNISDHWKEVALLRYACELATSSAIIFFMLLGCIVILVLPALLIDWLFNPMPSTIKAFTSGTGMLSMTTVSFFYAAVRKSFGKK